MFKFRTVETFLDLVRLVAEWRVVGAIRDRSLHGFLNSESGCDREVSQSRGQHKLALFPGACPRHGSSVHGRFVVKWASAVSWTILPESGFAVLVICIGQALLLLC